MSNMDNYNNNGNNNNKDDDNNRILLVDDEVDITTGLYPWVFKIMVLKLMHLMIPYKHYLISRAAEYTI